MLQLPATQTRRSPKDRPLMIHQTDGTTPAPSGSPGALPPVTWTFTPSGFRGAVSYDEPRRRRSWFRRGAWVVRERISGEGGEGGSPESAAQPALRMGAYEDERSEQRSLGSVSLAPDAWWSAALSVPITGGDGIAFFRLQRHGALPSDYLGDEEIDFSVPTTEIGAVLTLFGGIVAQARRDGVLSAPPEQLGGAGGVEVGDN